MAGESLVSDITTMGPAISDHEAIVFNLAAQKPKPNTNEIKYRNLKKIDTSKFGNDFNTSKLCNALPQGMNELTTLYNSELLHLLDVHATL